VLLVFPDQWRSDWTPANSAVPLRLPHLARLLTEGTNFTHAITSSPLCAPSRACFAMGVDYDSCPVKGNGSNLPLTAVTFYSKLRDHGYHTLACGKMDLAKGAHDWGIDGTHPMADGTTKISKWGFTDAIDNAGKQERVALETANCPYTHFLWDHQLLQEHTADFSKRGDQHNDSYRYTLPTSLPDYAYADNFEANNAYSLLQSVPKGQNWFLQVNFSGPHNPVDVTREMWESVQGRTYPPPIEPDPAFTPEEHNKTRQDYAAMLENIDTWLDKFRQLIEQRGETDNTIVIFASDHGEMLGDHQRWEKSVPYHASMGIPLIVAGPGISAGVENDSPVTLQDLAATILEMTHSLKGSRFMHGHSLQRILRGNATSVREIAVSGLGPWRAVYDGRWKLIRGFEPSQAGSEKKASYRGSHPYLLFDRLNDPDELANVIDQHPEVVARLLPYLDKSPDAGIERSG